MTARRTARRSRRPRSASRPTAAPRLKLAHRARDGQTLVEFALILPLLVMLTVGVIDAGRAVAEYNLVSEAARAGARVGRITPTQSAIEAAVLKELGTLNASPTVTYGVCTSGCEAYGSEGGEPFITVTVSAMYQPLVGQITGIIGAIPLTATSQQFLNNVAAAAGGPSPATFTPAPTANATQIADTTATAVAVETSAAVAELTATFTPSPTYAPLPTATPTPTGQYWMPTQLVTNTNDAQNYDTLIQCLVSGNATSSTTITWTSTKSTTLYFWLRPTSAGTPSVNDMKTFGQKGDNSTGVALSQYVAANKDYTLWVYNDGNGNSGNYDASIGQFAIICPH